MNSKLRIDVVDDIIGQLKQQSSLTITAQRPPLTHSTARSAGCVQWVWT